MLHAVLTPMQSISSVEIRQLGSINLNILESSPLDGGKSCAVESLAVLFAGPYAILCWTFLMNLRAISG